MPLISGICEMKVSIFLSGAELCTGVPMHIKSYPASLRASISDISTACVPIPPAMACATFCVLPLSE